jgi:hypothetical protein
LLQLFRFYLVPLLRSSCSALPALQQLVADTLTKVKTLPTTDPARYAALVKGLIAQGVSKLGEKDITVVGRREDLPVVQAAVAELSRDDTYSSYSLTVGEQFLPVTRSVIAVCA